MTKLKDVYPLYLANEAQQPNTDLEVTDKYTGEVAFRCALADAKTIDAGIAATVEAAEPMARMPAYERQAVLQHCVTRFTERFDELAFALCVEAGKPINDAEGEVSRLIDTFRIAAEESVRMTGRGAAARHFQARQRLSGHLEARADRAVLVHLAVQLPAQPRRAQGAPALAVGCPFVMKPASRTPLGALIMGEVLAETDLPRGRLFDPARQPRRRRPVHRGRSPEALELHRLARGRLGPQGQGRQEESGARTRRQCGGDRRSRRRPRRRGRSASSSALSTSPASPASASSASSSTPTSMTSCATAWSPAAGKLIAGNPHDRDTFVGPMIDVKEAKRLDGWIQEAVGGGATLLCGGKRDGAMLEATLLENVDRAATVVVEEAFGPVAVLSKFTRFHDALAEVNDSKFGLQAGVFTRDLFKMFDAWDHLDVGGVVINDVPSYRVDNMPYGGVKDSGLGREGVRFAMEDMTEIRNLVIRRGAGAALRYMGE
jgi:acyl-CoA reductase-like NAD-dependent aldehyde dehydrogenase